MYWTLMSKWRTASKLWLETNKVSSCFCDSGFSKHISGTQLHCINLITINQLVYIFNQKSEENPFTPHGNSFISWSHRVTPFHIPFIYTSSPPRHSTTLCTSAPISFSQLVYPRDLISVSLPAEAKAAEAAASASCATLPPTHVYLPQVSCPPSLCHTSDVELIYPPVSLILSFLQIWASGCHSALVQ